VRLTGDAELAARVLAALDRLAPPGPLGVAVSGGGDSVALMLMAAAWGRSRAVAVRVASVDHGLRPDAAAEAAAVAARAARLGLPADVLTLRDWRGRGNLQAEARGARTRALAGWARRTGLAAVALGHTRDDQAETVLMRLARGSGVDGLAAMTPRTRRGGVWWLRPLLGEDRAALRRWLRARGETWVEDPSNTDPRFARTRARAALAALAPLGLTPQGLAETADRMGRARTALEAATAALWRDAASVGPCGDVRLSLPPLRAAPREIALRAVTAALRLVGGGTYRPRAAASDALLDAALAGRLGGGRTLAGCMVAQFGEALIVVREPAAVGGLQGGVWDGRWRLTAPPAPGEIAALAEPGEASLRRADEGWTAPPGWAAAPRPARLTTPALWRGGRLVCAPAAGFGRGLWAQPIADPFDIAPHVD